MKQKYFEYSDFMKLSSPLKIMVLHNALGYMSQSNRRTENDCIALGMGYEYDEKTDKYFIEIKEKSKQ